MISIKKIAVLIVILLLQTCYGVAQVYFVNDIVPSVEPNNILQIHPILDTKVTFIENAYTLAVNKEDLLKSLKADAKEYGEEMESIFSIVINYLSKTDSLTFAYIWSKADDFQDVSWFETEKLGVRNLTKKVLKETICSLIEKGCFELFQNEKKENDYFYERVNSNYVGSVGTGVFSLTKRLIWICPPFYTTVTLPEE